MFSLHLCWNPMDLKIIVIELLYFHSLHFQTLFFLFLLWCSVYFSVTFCWQLESGNFLASSKVEAKHALNFTCKMLSLRVIFFLKVSTINIHMVILTKPFLFTFYFFISQISKNVYFHLQHLPLPQKCVIKLFINDHNLSFYSFPFFLLWHLVFLFCFFSYIISEIICQGEQIRKKNADPLD